MLTPFDHAIALLLVVIGPVFVARQYRKLLERVANQGSPARRRAYVKTMIRQWALAILVVALWIFTNRSFADLGLGFSREFGFFLGLGLLAFFIVLLGTQLRVVRSNPRAREMVRTKLARVRAIMPHDDRELGLFAAVSLTAGICEELLYRGFLTWYAIQFAPMWLAIPLVALAFGLGHAYQGARGIVATGAVGLALGLLCWLSGSLWLAMIAHALTDANSGLIARLAFDDVDVSQPTPAAPLSTTSTAPRS